MKVIKKSVQSGAKIKGDANPNDNAKKKTNVRIIGREMRSSKWQPSKLICTHEMCQFENHLRLSRTK